MESRVVMAGSLTEKQAAVYFDIHRSGHYNDRTLNP